MGHVESIFVDRGRVARFCEKYEPQLESIFMCRAIPDDCSSIRRWYDRVNDRPTAMTSQ